MIHATIFFENLKGFYFTYNRALKKIKLRMNFFLSFFLSNLRACKWTKLLHNSLLQHNDNHANRNEDGIIRGRRWHGRFARIYAEDHGHVHVAGKEGPLGITHCCCCCCPSNQKKSSRDLDVTFSRFTEKSHHDRRGFRRVLGRRTTRLQSYRAGARGRRRICRVTSLPNATNSAALWKLHKSMHTMIYYPRSWPTLRICLPFRSARLP